MKKLEKFYEVLGLDIDASFEEIEKYEQLSKELDPKNNDDQDFFKEEFLKVQEAYVQIKKNFVLAKTNVDNKYSLKSDVNNLNQSDDLQDKNKNSKIRKFFKTKFSNLTDIRFNWSQFILAN